MWSCSCCDRCWKEGQWRHHLCWKRSFWRRQLGRARGRRPLLIKQSRSCVLAINSFNSDLRNSKCHGFYFTSMCIKSWRIYMAALAGRISLHARMTWKIGRKSVFSGIHPWSLSYARIHGSPHNRGFCAKGSKKPPRYDEETVCLTTSQ